MKITAKLTALVLAFAVAGGPAVMAAENEGAVIKKYVRSGKLSAADVAKIKEEVKGELKNEIMSEIRAELKPVITSDVKEAVKSDIAAKISADKTKEIEVAKKEKDKEFRISGYTQIRYTDDNTPVNAGAGVSGGSSFNMARTRMIMQKKHDDKLNVFIQTNMTGNSAATATSSNDWKMTFLDATVNYLPTPDWEIRLGQFTLPFGLEVPLGAKDIYLVNYAMVGNNSQHEMIADDSRDIGARIKYNKKGNPFTYIVAVTNGEGVNRKNDSNDNKDFIGRLTYSPTKFWQVGVSGETGKRFKPAAAANAIYGATKSAATTARDFKRDKAGIDVKYKKDRWFWQGEYQWLRTGVAGRISDLLGRGGYIEGGYMFNPKFELALKEDVFQWDITNAAGNTTSKAHVIGLNWYFHKVAKWQFVYENRKETPSIGNDRFYSQIQMDF